MPSRRVPRSPPKSTPWILAAPVAGLLATAVPSGCATEVCTLVDCGDQSVVTFPPGLVAGAYDLLLTSDLGTLTARCGDPGAPEAVSNPPELTCDANGLQLDGHVLASARELNVTITQVSDDAVVADAVLVTLDVAEENTPNGPDCPPTCYIRNGQLLPEGQPD